MSVRRIGAMLTPGVVAALALGAGARAADVIEVPVEEGSGAIMRGLDRVSGDVREFSLAPGESATVGRLQVTLGECRYPQGDPDSDAYAWVVVREGKGEKPIFEGWMIASSPALDALDHPRFDVWVIRCTTD